MIGGMARSWTATIEQLRQLNQLRRFQQLKQALDRLPTAVPVEHQGEVARWRGKLALLDGDHAGALSYLVEAQRLQSGDPTGLGLLGSVFIRRQQWLDAQRVLELAVSLAPDVSGLRIALAQANLAMGAPAMALWNHCRIRLRGRCGRCGSRRQWRRPRISPLQWRPLPRHFSSTVACRSGS